MTDTNPKIKWPLTFLAAHHNPPAVEVIQCGAIGEFAALALDISPDTLAGTAADLFWMFGRKYPAILILDGTGAEVYARDNTLHVKHKWPDAEIIRILRAEKSHIGGAFQAATISNLDLHNLIINHGGNGTMRRTTPDDAALTTDLIDYAARRRENLYKIHMNTRRTISQGAGESPELWRDELTAAIALLESEIEGAFENAYQLIFMAKTAHQKSDPRLATTTAEAGERLINMAHRAIKTTNDCRAALERDKDATNMEQ